MGCLRPSGVTGTCRTRRDTPIDRSLPMKHAVDLGGKASEWGPPFSPLERRCLRWTGCGGNAALFSRPPCFLDSFRSSQPLAVGGGHHDQLFLLQKRERHQMIVGQVWQYPGRDRSVHGLHFDLKERSGGDGIEGSSKGLPSVFPLLRLWYHPVSSQLVIRPIGDGCEHVRGHRRRMLCVRKRLPQLQRNSNYGGPQVISRPKASYHHHLTLLPSGNSLSDCISMSSPMT